MASACKTCVRKKGDKLSKRETEVYALVTRGLSNKEIGSKLFVAEKTVKYHMTSILKKMGLKTRFELMRFAAEERLSKTMAGL